MELLIINANLYSLSNPSNKPKIKGDMNNLNLLENGAIAVENGIIKDVDTTDNITRRYKDSAKEIVDAGGRAVLPGFVDPHTHAVFVGTREKEFKMRLEGKSYLEILNAGGGILNSVESIRNASKEEIADELIKRVNIFYEWGTTTFEAKSGYGLDFKNEIKMLESIKAVNDLGIAQIVPTFIGAHAIPREFKDNKQKYIDIIINEMIPYIAENRLAEFIDVFCEEGVYTPNETSKILQTGLEYGLKAKLHADEIKSIGCSELAENIEIVSCDHLLKIKDSGIEALKKRNTIATLLPGTAFSLKEGFADARKLIDSSIPVAIATDCNPGSSYTESMPTIITLAVLMMNMTIEEAIFASTINASFAISRNSSLGSLEISKQADFIILKENSYLFIPYHYGVNPIWRTYKKGKKVYDADSTDN